MPNGYVYVWSTDVQYSLTSNLVATLGYQGSSGHKLIRIVNQNFLYTGQSAVLPGLISAAGHELELITRSMRD